MDYQLIIDKYYPAGTPLRDIYMKHCGQVARLALDLNARQDSPLDPDEVEAAAMLHDIGICRCTAPSIECRGELPYIAHGIAGAEMLRAEGAPEAWAGVAMRHTGAGITREEIAEQGLPLPPADYLPQSRLERLVCYADKFFSKSGDMRPKAFERVRRQLARFGHGSLERFDAMASEFGKP